MSVRGNVLECYLISINGISDKVRTCFGNYHIAIAIVTIPMVTDAVKYLELIIFLKVDGDSPGALILRFYHEMIFIDLPIIDRTLYVHSMCYR